MGGADDALDPAFDAGGAADAAPDGGRRDGGPRSDSGARDAGADTFVAPPDDAGELPDTFVAPDTGALGADAGVDAGVDSGGGMDSGSTCAGHGFSGALVTYNLTGQTGSETTFAASSSATGVAGGALTRSAALTIQSGADSINSSNWPLTSTADATKYYTFGVTPGAGCTVTLSSLAISTNASATGPAQADVATSADNFATHKALGVGTKTLTLSNISGSGAIEVRVYGFAASSTSGTLRIQNTMTLSGSLQ